MKYINIDNVDLDKRLPKIDFNIDDGAYELACSVFNNCNLHCKFCFQDHSSLKTFNQIREDSKKIPDILIKFLEDESKKYTINTVHLKMWGGELFYDAIPDDFFDIYYNIYNRLDKAGIARISPTWLTNGVFTKRQRVLDLLKATNGIIGFSYDPIDRFSEIAQVQKLVQNIIIFDYFNVPETLSITLAKKAIHNYIDKPWPLKKNIRTDISYYTPGLNWKEDIPSDEDMYLFFKWAIDNDLYFIRAAYDILVAYFGDFIKHYCNCAKAAQYDNGHISKNCALRAHPSIKTEQFYGEFTSKVNESNCAEYKNSLGLIKRGCLICEWYKTCQKPCWISVIFDGYKTTQCPFERIYSYLDTLDREYLKSKYELYKEFWRES